MRALAIELNHVTALLWRSLYFSAMRRHPDAIASVERAREIEPLSSGVNLYLGRELAHASIPRIVAAKIDILNRMIPALQLG